MTAEEVKAALRRHHPGASQGSFVARWTCIEEWRGIDLLALDAWRSAQVIGYEVKVSRGDLRRELLKPYKRTTAVEMTNQFFFAVPDGLLTDEEIAYQEPEWEEGDFERTLCPGVPEFGGKRHHRSNRWQHHPYGGRCRRYGRGEKQTVPVPVADVIVAPDWMKPFEGEVPESFEARLVREHHYLRERHRAVCWKCGGLGYLEKSQVEREAPMCWVPRDVGLVVITPLGVGEVKKSPRRNDPKPIASTRQQINDLVRWVSHRPDPRHR